MTVATDWAFSALSGSGWSGWGGTVGNDPSAPVSPTGVWELLFPSGYEAGGAPGERVYTFQTPRPTRIFIGMWWRTSDPWQYQSVGDKLFYVFDEPAGGNSGGLYLLQQGGPPHNLTITTQNGAENRNLPTVAQTPVTVGAWHRIELYLSWSPTGTGVVRLWLDGVLQTDVSNVRWQNGAGFERLSITPVWGGIGGTKQRDDYFYYDHVYVSRAP